MTTYLQSITIEFPSSPYIFYGMEPCPICPYSFKDTDKVFIAMKVLDGSVISWWRNGSVIKILPDGTTKTWSPRPTLKDIVAHSSEPSNKGWYVEFYTDKSIVVKTLKGVYYWSSPINGSVEEGVELTNYEYDTEEYDEEEVAKKYPECYNCSD